DVDVSDHVGPHESGSETIGEREKEVVDKEERGGGKDEADPRPDEPAELVSLLEAFPVGDVLACFPSFSNFSRTALRGLGRQRTIHLHGHLPPGGQGPANMAVGGRADQSDQSPDVHPRESAYPPADSLTLALRSCSSAS